MFRKRMLISVVLLIGTLLLIISSAQGAVFEMDPPQNFCSSKLALKTGKCALPNNDLRYSMKHAVLTNSAEWKHKTTSRSISQGCIGMTGAVYMTELLGGLVGAYLMGYYGGLYISIVAAQLLAPAYDTYPEVLVCRVFSFINPPAAAVGAATATTYTGIILNQKGSFAGALIGSALGVAVGTFICFGYDSSLLWHLRFPCASIGAVLGYNYVLGRPGTKPWRQ